MKTNISTSILLLLFIFSSTSYAQNIQNQSVEEGGEYPMERNDANNPCITKEQYKIIEKQCTDNIKLLGLENAGKKNPMATLFNWPVKTVNGLNDCSYYYIGNYLDQDTTSPGIRDWNCGSVTYDGHHGTDICIFPYPFYKMDNNQVEVIAAAPGTIINKVDGHFDKNCDMGDSTANYIVIQHVDGSCAMYWHMKKNSLTSKIIGQTVVTGEYLGLVGSSGSSSGPHLHFEVLSGITMNTLNDSYAGPCNTLNANSWWAVQKPYTEPAIIQTSVHPALAVFPACPETETPNEDSCFAAGSSVKFYTFYRNETSGMVSDMRIVNPDGSTFTSWTHNSNLSHLCSFWISTKTLPTIAGTYTFEATYNGIVCSKSFKINCNSSVISEKISASTIDIYPNPFSSLTTLQADKTLKDATLTIFNSYGQQVKQIKNVSGQTISLQRDKLPSGLYFLRLIEGNETYTTCKIIITDN
jgi:hypothetical protein